jgi:manganese/zinc/iron transport system substrate-binding protein
MNNTMKKLVGALGLLLILGSLALAQEPLRAVATVGMVGDVVGEVGGDCVMVTTLMGPGTDPHLYRASAGDVRTLDEAEVIFYAGLRLEGQMVDVLERLGQRRPALAVMETVPREALIEEDEDEALEFDPHLWMDPSLWARTIDGVAEMLIELRPDCEARILENAERYETKLLALHGWARETLATIPQERRVLVTAHDAFYYFGRAFSFDVVEGIQGISTEAEAGVADIRATVDLVVSRGVPAIFPETTVNPRNIEAVRAAARDRGFEVMVGGELFSDAMGEAGSWQGTYIGMIRSNVLTVAEALGGEKAPWPEALRPWAERWGLD